MEFIKNLFRKPHTIEFKWSAMGVMPDGGSLSLSTGDNGKAVPIDNVTGVQPVGVNCTGKQLIIKFTPAPTGGATILLYKYIGSTLVPGWCPYFMIEAGQSELVVNMSQYTFSSIESVQAWMGYPVGLPNTGAVDVSVKLICQR